MIAPFQTLAKGHRSKTNLAPKETGLVQRDAKSPAMNASMGDPEPKADLGEKAARGFFNPAHNFSFSHVGVLAVQRKCACGGSSGAAGQQQCDECGRKRALGLQPKLTVNQPGDAYEQEADRVAGAMMGSFSRPSVPESDAGAEHQEPPESELMKGGEQLPAGVAGFYEVRFGRDLSHVRVHTGETALRYNDAVNAYAFTYGSHIWLGHGLRLEPSHILAHELAHVVQQTQPPHLDSRSGQPELSLSGQSVQRFLPFWMPSELVAKGKRVGNQTHKLVLPKIGKLNNIFTEAPVPNANSMGEDEVSTGVDYGKTGIADMYQASSTVGVFFAGVKQPQKLKSNPNLLYQGERYSHITNSAPQADESRESVIRAGVAPKEILVGDLKPSHGTIEAQKGPQQVQDYLKGFELARNEVNSMPVGEGGRGQTDKKWPELTTGIIDVNIPDEFKEPAGSGQDPRYLVLMHNGKPIRPRRPVQGKVYIKPDPGGGGIWNYIWAPTTPVTAADLPPSVTQFGAEVTDRIVNPLLVSPVKPAKKAKPAPPASSLTTAPRRIQTQPRVAPAAEVKDPFDEARFETWKADHNRLTGEEKRLEKTPEFEEAELKSLATQDRQAAIKSGFNLPAVTSAEEKASKTVDKIRFWTGASSAVFGKLRRWFGGAFVKVVNVYHAIRARFQSLLDKEPAPTSSGLPGTIIKIAFQVLKAAGRVVVERTARHLVNSLEKGVEQKLKALIPQDKIEDFEAKVKEIEELAANLERQAVETVEALVGKAIAPYEKYIKTAADVAKTLSTVSDVVSKVRWGARVVACLSPPGWGCLWILLESVIEKFASWLVDRCWFKREIAPLVTGVEFISKLPAYLAENIIGLIKSILPSQVHDVFADIDPTKIEKDFKPHEICDGNDYPTTRDRDLIEKLALAELRKEIGEDKWQAWVKLGELYGVNRGDFLNEEQVVKLKRELKKASLASLKEAAELYPAVQPGTHLTNLTAFLEEVERVKEEMSGSGGTGGGQDGAGEISVTASEKAVEANYKPTKHAWEVVGGVTRGQYQGHVIKVDVAASISNTVVTLDDVEVRVANRVSAPNEGMVVHMEVTKDQYFDIEKKYGAETVKKIGHKSFRYKKGTKLRYTLQRTAEKVK